MLDFQKERQSTDHKSSNVWHNPRCIQHTRKQKYVHKDTRTHIHTCTQTHTQTHTEAHATQKKHAIFMLVHMCMSECVRLSTQIFYANV